jgi:hypothetical protein
MTPQRKWLLKLAVFVPQTCALFSQLKPLFVILIAREVNVHAELNAASMKYMAWRYRPTHSLYQYEMKASDTFQDQAA